MVFLGVAVFLFSGVHLIPALPGVKGQLKDRFGMAYGPLFGLAATITLLAIITAWSFAELEPVYEPGENSRLINMAFSFVAFGFLGVFFFRGKLRQIIRFPFAIAVIFWAIGHLIANGDLASLILFGGLLVFAVTYIVLGLANQVYPTRDVRESHDVLSLVTGLAFYIVMVQLHEVIIGVPVIPVVHIL